MAIRTSLPPPCPEACAQSSAPCRMSPRTLACAHSNPKCPAVCGHVAVGTPPYKLPDFSMLCLHGFVNSAPSTTTTCFYVPLLGSGDVKEEGVLAMWSTRTALSSLMFVFVFMLAAGSAAAQSGFGLRAGASGDPDQF